MIKKIIQKSARYYTESDKHQLIQAYLESGVSKQYIWEQYTGQLREHGTLLRWMRELGYAADLAQNRLNIVAPNLMSMSKAKPSEQDFEKRQLQKRIAELEQQLKDAEMKVIAFSTLVDVAEEMFKVPIRKKLNIKP